MSSAMTRWVTFYDLSSLFHTSPLSNCTAWDGWRETWQWLNCNELHGSISLSYFRTNNNEHRQNAADSGTKKFLYYLDLLLDPEEAAVINFATKLLEKDDDRITFHFLLSMSSVEHLPWHGPTFASWTTTRFPCYCGVCSKQQGAGNIFESCTLAAATFPAITIVGTNPVFCKITVTTQPSTAV